MKLIFASSAERRLKYSLRIILPYVLTFSFSSSSSRSSRSSRLQRISTFAVLTGSTFVIIIESETLTIIFDSSPISFGSFEYILQKILRNNIFMCFVILENSVGLFNSTLSYLPTLTVFFNRTIGRD